MVYAPGRWVIINEPSLAALNKKTARSGPDEAIIEQINLDQRLTEDTGPPMMVDENALSSVALAR